MAKESPYVIGRQPIFKETFNSEAEVRRNGGTPTGITFVNGIARFTSATSRIETNFSKNAVCSIRVIFKPTDFSRFQYLFQIGAAYCFFNQTSGTLVKSAGTIYVNGVATNVTTANTILDILITGITVTKSTIYKYIGWDTGAYALNGDLELLEIYQGTLSADEVKNLYENKRFKDLNVNHGEQLGSEITLPISVANGWSLSAEWSASDFIASYNNLGNGNLLSNAFTAYTGFVRFTITTTNTGRCAVVDQASNVISETATRTAGTYTFLVFATSATRIGIRAYSTYGAFSVTLISIKQVLVNSTKEILNVSADSGVVRNKYSGERYGAEYATPAVIYSSPGMVITSLNDPVYGVYSNISDATDVSPRFQTSASFYLINTKTYRVTVRLKGSGGLDYYNGSIYVNIAVASSSWATYTFDTLAYGNGILFQLNNRYSVIDFQCLSVKEVIPSVVNTAVSVVKQGDVNAMLFNGSTSKIDCGSYDTLVGDKTFVAWFNPTKTITSQYLISNGKLIIAYTSGGALVVYSDSVTGASTAAAIKNNVFQCLMVTRSSVGITNIYYNGILTGTANQSSGTPVAGTTNITIGNWTTVYSKIIGSNFRIIDGILTAQEINQLYHAEKYKYGL